ncbi:MAG: glycosyltransferase [Clostridiales bacterium]|nr:glycosyltransferase [Clostridiales bacterium]
MKLLYITFIDMNDAPSTGSSVRPLKMLEAFEALGVEVVTVSGMNNNLKARKKAVKEIKNKLKTWTPDLCYIEPPTGPFFYHGDVGLVKYIHRKGIPMSIFYRDAYWKYPEYYINKDTPKIDVLKHKVIKCMQQHQWNVFKKTMDIIYFPSLTMANEFDFGNKKILPPGSFIPDFTEKTTLSDPLTFIFVGGAAKNHGTHLTLEAFEKVNSDKVRAKVTYICPKEQWDGLGIDKDKYSEWLDIVHASGSALTPYYEKSDVALLTAPKTFYRDFAVPIKVFEYCSYLKPMLVTNCTETARIVNDNHAGWVTDDNVESVCERIIHLCENPDEVLNIRDNMKEARDNNLWINRAKQVIEDLKRNK